MTDRQGLIGQGLTEQEGGADFDRNSRKGGLSALDVGGGSSMESFNGKGSCNTADGRTIEEPNHRKASEEEEDTKKEAEDEEEEEERHGDNK